MAKQSKRKSARSRLSELDRQEADLERSLVRLNKERRRLLQDQINQKAKVFVCIRRVLDVCIEGRSKTDPPKWLVRGLPRLVGAVDRYSDHIFATAFSLQLWEDEVGWAYLKFVGDFAGDEESELHVRIPQVDELEFIRYSRLSRFIYRIRRFDSREEAVAHVRSQGGQIEEA